MHPRAVLLLLVVLLVLPLPPPRMMGQVAQAPASQYPRTLCWRQWCVSGQELPWVEVMALLGCWGCRYIFYHRYCRIALALEPPLVLPLPLALAMTRNIVRFQVRNK